jgi:ATP citrate lyase citrate-binding
LKELEDCQKPLGLQNSFYLCLVYSATANPDGRKRALLVGGGIANFTDVAATFKGIIAVSQTSAHCCCTTRLDLDQNDI